MAALSSMRTLKYTLHRLLQLVLLVTPLIFVTNTKELYEFPKMFFVYLLGSTTICLFVANCIISNTKPKLPNLYITTFLAANIISTVASSHKYTSLWGYYSRFNGGLMSILIFWGLHIVALNNKEFLKKSALVIPILTIFPIGILGIEQHFDGTTRVHSTLGQANWLAAYIAMVLPIIIFGILKSRGHSSPISKALLYITYLIGFATLWYTYSLSGILGFTVSISFFTLLNKKLILQNRSYLLALVVGTVIIAGTNLGTFKQRIEDVLLDLVYAQGKTHNLSDPGFIRTNIWKGTLQLIVSDPKAFLVGTGPETFPYSFQRYRPPELNYSSEWDFILNKPHNHYLETFAETGILGIAPFLLIIFHSIKQRHPILTPALIAFYTTNIFGWPTVATDLLFWIWLALL
jgi:O-antigen ligase